MKYLILTGSPRLKGNTSKVVEVFRRELERADETVQVIDLHLKKIKPCIDCKLCQRTHTEFGCAVKDEMGEIAEKMIAADRIVLATPIYSWFCTPPMKSLLDRCIRAMNKYYGETMGPALLDGKELFLLITCGYPPKKGSDLFIEGMRRFAKHSRMEFGNELSLHDPGKMGEFWTKEKEEQARIFVREVMKV